jgi:hypothetical protein
MKIYSNPEIFVARNQEKTAKRKRQVKTRIMTQARLERAPSPH